MPSSKPRALLEIEYYEAAQAYLKSLPPEHFMEAQPQGVQREITLESLRVIRRARPDVQYFNELLIQYRLRPGEKVRQVVPDNFVVLHEGEIAVKTSFDREMQPAPPFWTLEYVSKESKRKDYEDNFERYEKELKVPYYLLFYPDNEELTLYRRVRSKYVSVKPDSDERYAIQEIETKVGLLGGWVRFWFRGELVQLPDALLDQLDEVKRERDEARREVAELRSELADKDAEIARLLAQLKQLRGE
jgi:Uma2 family endonuclease